jgi:predicted transcriptional regulator
VKLPSRNRDRTEITRDILQTTRDKGIGVRKTKIMYSVFLSHGQVNKHVAQLVDKGLLQQDLGNQKYRITEKGLNFLNLCDQIGDLMEEKKSDEEEQKRIW